jgi:hypothetical protein
VHSVPLAVEVNDGPESLIDVGMHSDRVGDVLWIYVGGLRRQPPTWQ